MAKHKTHVAKRRPFPGPRPGHRRNGEIPDDVLLPLAPVQPPFHPSAAMSPPYPYAAPSRPRPRPAIAAVKRKAGALAQAMKPEGATITKDHLIGVGANAAGGVATALLASELVDNVGVMPMAIGATVVGGLGSTLLKGRWQQLAQGVLGAGVGQLGTAYLTERALKKAAAAQKLAAPATPAAPAAGGKRNAYLGDGDDDAMLRVIDRSERRLDALIADGDARNAYGDSGVDADLFDAYGYGYAA